MTTGYNQAKDEMLAVFLAAWDPLLYVAYDDIAAAPAEGTWCRVTLRHFTGEQLTLADTSGITTYERTGKLYFQIFTPKGDGQTSGGDIADVISTAYEKTKGGCVRYTNITINEVGQSGAFEQINVLCDFSYRYTR